MSCADVLVTLPVEYFVADFSWDNLKEQLGISENSDAVCDTETGMYWTIFGGTWTVRTAFILSCVEGLVVVDGQTATWESFHCKHSSARFFKVSPKHSPLKVQCLTPPSLSHLQERRYLSSAFPLLATSSSTQLVLEVGCGTGANVLPLLRSRLAARVPFKLDAHLPLPLGTADVILTMWWWRWTSPPLRFASQSKLWPLSQKEGADSSLSSATRPWSICPPA